jgi:hypothetical protein
MHNEQRRRRINNYAKVLLLISIALLVYGGILDYNSKNHLIDPVRDVESVPNDGSDITVSTIEDVEIGSTKGDAISPKPEAQTPPQPENQPPSETPVVTPKNNTEGTSNNYVPTIEDFNEQIRNDILNRYGVEVRYGNETIGYTIVTEDTRIKTEPITDSTLINSQLTRLKNALGLYPSGMFQEIKKGGIPLTVYLIDHYSNVAITGITDSSYSYANISIAAMYPFEESFYHESYHYIERYLFKKGANFNSWNSINPEGFNYGTIYNDWSYNLTFSQDAPFVNNYAQSADTEDRACTFEYMMAPNKASCLNQGTRVWTKAKAMALTIENVLKCASADTIEYWERFL